MIKLFLQFYSISFKKGLLISFYLLRKLFFYKIAKKNNFIYSRAKYAGRKSMRKEINALKKKVFTPSFNNIIQFELILSSHKESISSFEVMNLKLDFDEKIFLKDFEDFEMKMAVHRFVWLYDLLINDVSKEDLISIKKLIFKWIENFDSLDHNVTHESYSIGERVSSWLFFYAFSNQHLNYSKEEKKLLIDSICKQIGYLTDNIELQGEFTNNHILNNGKVFYIAGEFLNVKEWKNFGTHILKSEFDNFFIDDFFLENSSHYQMIYAKNFMEMSMVCEFGRDKELQKWFEDKTRSILVHCRNLQSTKKSFRSMPFFGDISPDINPKWVTGYPFSINKNKISKWHKLFKYEIGGVLDDSILNKKIKKTRNYIKIEHLNFEIWIWIKDLGLGAHGHQDNGNFVVFHNGNPIVIDPGRFKYKKDKVSQNQICTEAHFLPFSSEEVWDFMPGSPLANNSFFKSHLNIKVINNSKLVFLISNWNSKIQIKRTILLLKEKLVFLDESVKGNEFCTNLIFPFKKKDIFLKDNVFLIGNVKLKIENESLINETKILDGQYSESYGSLIKGSKISIKLKKKNKYTFNIN